MYRAAFCLALLSLWPARWPHEAECGDPAPESHYYVPLDGVVDEMLDAATLQVRTAHGRVRVAIANIDPTSGPAAIAALRKRVEHKWVQVRGDSDGVPKGGVAEVYDYYGDIALTFLSAGLARFAESPAYSTSSYVECTHRIAEQEAKAKHLGLWKVR